MELNNDLKNKDIYLYNDGNFFKINKRRNIIDYNIISKELKCEL